MMKSWKTTLVGGLLAVAIAIQPIVEKEEFRWETLILAALVALVSYFAKDKDVSGSAPQQ